MLTCKSCGQRFDLSENVIRCECGGILENDIQSGEIRDGNSIWKRFRDFYDFEIETDHSLGEGDTPLVRSNKIADRYDLELCFKNETVNPTWSFKDRGTFTGLNRAVNLGYTRLGTVSTGNMGVSVAAYGSRAGLDTAVLVSSTISENKVKQIGVYGPRIIKVKGDYGQLYFESLDIGMEKDIYFLNSDDPFRVEGYKTIGFEIFEEIIPEHILMPTSSGGLFRGIVKGFRELIESDLLTEMPNLISVQSEGCSPIYRAYKEGKENIDHWDDPDSVAHSIENPYPPSGDEVLRLVKKYGGTIVTVNNDEILSAQKDLAGDGIFAQPASCVGIAALEQLNEKEIINKKEKVVSIITGAGIKDVYSVRENDESVSCRMEDLKDNL
ncbi:MAG: threonine synthase [Thermoplasmata archaeon]